MKEMKKEPTIGSMTKYEEIKVLGQGSYGRVLLVRYRASKKEYAMKVVSYLGSSKEICEGEARQVVYSADQNDGAGGSARKHRKIGGSISR